MGEIRHSRVSFGLLWVKIKLNVLICILRLRQVKNILAFNAARLRMQKLASPMSSKKVTWVEDSPPAKSTSTSFKYALDTDDTQVTEEFSFPGATSVTPDGAPTFPEVPDSDSFITRRDQLELRKANKAEKGEESGQKKASKKPGKSKRKACDSEPKACGGKGKASKACNVKRKASNGKRKACDVKRKASNGKRKALSSEADVAEPAPKAKAKATAKARSRASGSEASGSKGPRASGSKASGSKSKTSGSIKASGSKARRRSKVSGSKASGSRASGSRASGSKASGSKASGSKASGSIKASGSKARGSKPTAAEAAAPKASKMLLEMEAPVTDQQAAKQDILDIINEWTQGGLESAHDPNVTIQFPTAAPVRLVPYWKKWHCGVKILSAVDGVTKWRQPYYLSWDSPCMCTKIYCATQIVPCPCCFRLLQSCLLLLYAWPLFPCIVRLGPSPLECRHRERSGHEPRGGSDEGGHGRCPRGGGDYVEVAA